MSDIIFFDPLFRTPFFVGLILALVVPLLGPYLRLRQEWLAAIGLSHIAAAGVVLGPIVGLPVPAPVLAVAAAGATAGSKAFLKRAGNEIYGLAILLGWTVMLLGMANHAHSKVMGEALIDGQLYFASSADLLAAAVMAVLLCLALPPLSRLLLREHLFPGQAQANRRPMRVYHLVFDLLVAVALAIATSAMGIMAAFGLVFLPAWTAFAFAASWRQALALSVVIAVAAYVIAFHLAMQLDQPYGPIFVAVLLAFLPLRLLAYRRRVSA